MRLSDSFRRRAAAGPAAAIGRWALRHHHLLLCLGIFAVGLATRLYHIGAMPFWLDEVTTVRRSNLAFWPMLEDALTAHHLPAYFWIAAFSGRYGLDETVLRLPSALFGGASAAVLYVAGTRVGGWKAGLVAGLLLALSPLQVQYGQEARSYTLVMLMMAIGLVGLLELARDPAAASRPWRAGAARWPWLLYGLGTLGALQVLSTAWFWFISANCAALAIARDPAADRRRFWRRWATAQGLILICTMPWFLAMTVLTHGRMASGVDWVPPVTAHSFFSTIGSLYFMRISRLISFHLFPVVVPGFGALLVLLSLFGLAGWHAGQRRAGLSTLLRALLVAALVPPVLILVISVTKPLWMPRYLLWSAVPFFIFVGLGVARLPRPSLQWGTMAAVTLLAAINLAPYYDAETKPRWDIAGRDLVNILQPGDLILVPDRGPIAIMNFFLARDGLAIPEDRWTRDVFKAAAHVQEGGRVWVVQGKVGQADHTTRKGFDAITAPLGSPIAVLPEGELITFKLYDRLPDENLMAQGAGAPQL